MVSKKRCEELALAALRDYFSVCEVQKYSDAARALTILVSYSVWSICNFAGRYSALYVLDILYNDVIDTSGEEAKRAH